jgi:hypothetical protein
MLCIGYYEAFQRKKRANSWSDCHSRVGASRQQAQKKSVGISRRRCEALLELAAWLQVQVWEDRAIALLAGIAAGSRAE